MDVKPSFRASTQTPPPIPPPPPRFATPSKSSAATPKTSDVAMFGVFEWAFSPWAANSNELMADFEKDSKTFVHSRHSFALSPKQHSAPLSTTLRVELARQRGPSGDLGFEGAAERFRKGLERADATLGPRHPVTIQCAAELGACLTELGESQDWAEAEECLVRVLRFRESQDQESEPLLEQSGPRAMLLSPLNSSSPLPPPPPRWSLPTVDAALSLCEMWRRSRRPELAVPLARRALAACNAMMPQHGGSDDSTRGAGDSSSSGSREQATTMLAPAHPPAAAVEEEGRWLRASKLLAGCLLATASQTQGSAPTFQDAKDKVKDAMLRESEALFRECAEVEERTLGTFHAATRASMSGVVNSMVASQSLGSRQWGEEKSGGGGGGVTLLDTVQGQGEEEGGGDGVGGVDLGLGEDWIPLRPNTPEHARRLEALRLAEAVTTLPPANLNFTSGPDAYGLATQSSPLEPSSPSSSSSSSWMTSLLSLTACRLLLFGSLPAPTTPPEKKAVLKGLESSRCHPALLPPSSPSASPRQLLTGQSSGLGTMVTSLGTSKGAFSAASALLNTQGGRTLVLAGPVLALVLFVLQATLKTEANSNSNYS